MAEQPHRHGDMQLVKQSRFPWPVVALVVAGLLLLAILFRPSRELKSTPADTPVAVRPTSEQVQFENIQVVPSPTPGKTVGNKVTVQADLRNLSDTPISGLQVEAVFMDENGEAIHRQMQPVMAVEKQAGRKRTKEVSLEDSPILPRGVRAVRMTFSAVPVNWNKQDPQLNVKEVTGKPLAKPSAGQP
ncbi:MAG: FxLYD domain-containing protein [Acidobacteriales bacterium]|nr:FxLYD domain-containing protein [Terriglobales bacterium]